MSDRPPGRSDAGVNITLSLQRHEATAGRLDATTGVHAACVGRNADRVATTEIKASEFPRRFFTAPLSMPVIVGLRE